MSRLLLAVVGIAAAAPALACTDGNDVRAYFSYDRIERGSETPQLQVEIMEIDAGRGHVRARLAGPFARLSPDGAVMIDLPAAPMGTNCVIVGPTDGPVFVAGTVRRTASGSLSMSALPIALPPPHRPPAPPGGYDQYIVDPALRSRPPQ